MLSSIATVSPRRVAALEARNITKCHTFDGGRVEVLHESSIAIEKGDFVAITGASGSGKSTLLSLLGTLDAPTAGSILIDGVNTSDLAPKAMAAFRNAHIGFVFQHFHLLPRTSALDQVLLPALYDRRANAAASLKSARARLEDVGLAGYERHMPSQLSGGQQQRVAIARALMNSPGLILADEPTGALDQNSGREIMALLQQLNQRGMTIVIVTHDPSVAQSARRIVRMCDGSIVSNTAMLRALA